jgi:hypothetical protein
MKELSFKGKTGRIFIVSYQRIAWYAYHRMGGSGAGEPVYLYMLEGG